MRARKENVPAILRVFVYQVHTKSTSKPEQRIIERPTVRLNASTKGGLLDVYSEPETTRADRDSADKRESTEGCQQSQQTRGIQQRRRIARMQKLTEKNRGEQREAEWLLGNRQVQSKQRDGHGDKRWIQTEGRGMQREGRRS